MSRLTALCLRLGLALAAVAPALCWAQENPAYQAAHQRGTTAFNAGNFAECAEEFRRAFDVEPRGNLLYNIAFCYEKAGDLPNAITFYQRFIDAVPTSPKRPQVQRLLDQLKGQIQDEFVDINVSSDPVGAQVFVNDKGGGAMGATPLTFKLLPGSYLIIAESQGYEPAKRKVDVKKGDTVMVELNLVSTDQIGTYSMLVTERDADVLVDNRKVGKAPITEPLRLKQGRHELLVTKTGFKNWSKTIEVKAGANETIKVDMVEEGAAAAAAAESGGLFSGDRLLPTITAAAGLGITVGGAVIGMSASKLYDDLKKKRDAGELIHPNDIKTGKSRVLMTNLLLGTGSAAVVGGAVWWFLAGSGDAPDVDGSISGGVGADGQLMVWGSF
jgi:hypothetical protein